jgi:fimbrial isopeptide formation D2 family protein
MGFLHIHNVLVQRARKLSAVTLAICLLVLSGVMLAHLQTETHAAADGSVIQGNDIFRATGRYKMSTYSSIPCPASMGSDCHTMSNIPVALDADSTVAAVYLGFILESYDPLFLNSGDYGGGFPTQKSTFDIAYNNTTVAPGHSISRTRTIPSPVPGANAAIMQYTDITDIVQAHGAGNYRLGGNQWASSLVQFLVIVQENPTYPPAFVVFNDSFFSNTDNRAHTIDLQFDTSPSSRISNQGQLVIRALGTTFDYNGGGVSGGVDTATATYRAIDTLHGNKILSQGHLINQQTGNANRFFSVASWNSINVSLPDAATRLDVSVQVDSTAADGTSLDTEVAGFFATSIPVEYMTTQKAVLDDSTDGVAAAGEDVHYTIIVANDGELDRNYNVVDRLENVIKMIDDPSANVVTVTNSENGAVTYGTVQDLMTTGITVLIPTDSYALFEFTVTVREDFAGGIQSPVVNTAHVTPEGGETIDVDASIKAGPSITKGVVDASGDGLAMASEELTYTITISNPWDDEKLFHVYDPLTNVLPILADPAERPLLLTNGTYLDIDAATVTNLLEGFDITIEGGETATITFTVTVRDDYVGPLEAETLVNVVEVTPEGELPLYAEASIRVGRLPAVPKTGAISETESATRTETDFAPLAGGVLIVVGLVAIVQQYLRHRSSSMKYH